MNYSLSAEEKAERLASSRSEYAESDHGAAATLTFRLKLNRLGLTASEIEAEIKGVQE
jgi:hypothetical protein